MESIKQCIYALVASINNEQKLKMILQFILGIKGD